MMVALVRCGGGRSVGDSLVLFFIIHIENPFMLVIGKAYVGERDRDTVGGESRQLHDSALCLPSSDSIM